MTQDSAAYRKQILIKDNNQKIFELSQTELQLLYNINSCVFYNFFKNLRFRIILNHICKAVNSESKVLIVNGRTAMFTNKTLP